MKKEQRDLVRATKKMFAHVRKEMEPNLLIRPEPQWQQESYRNLQYAQNVIRTCMEASLQEMLPYTHEVSVELAIRLASYSLSIVPMEDQDYVMALFMKNFSYAHERRMDQGLRIETQWADDNGAVQPNFPNEYREPSGETNLSLRRRAHR
jgi:hypothetical protein